MTEQKQELAVLQDLDLDLLDEVAKSTSAYLPRINLTGGKSKLVEEGKIGVGHLVVIYDEETFTDLGKKADMIVLSYRPKALDLNGETPIDCYDVNEELFRIIKETALDKSNPLSRKCSFGAEFLVYIPEQKAFATYFANSPTAKRSLEPVKLALRMLKKGEVKVLEMTGKIIKNKKEGWVWWGPVFTITDTVPDTPKPDVIEQEVKNFLNPPKRKVEIVTESEEDTTGSERE